MKRLFYILMAFVALCACSGSTPEEQAAKAARAYYTHLADDRPMEFLEGKAGLDSLPGDYCDQLLKAVQQYMADMVEKHGGLCEVSISNNVGRRDTSLHLTYAFLLLHYADSTQEEITVPMVNVDGDWLMK